MTGGKYSVVVIGAGVAGLAAAQRLTRELGDQVDVTILEGTDRIGGRVFTYMVWI